MTLQAQALGYRYPSGHVAVRAVDLDLCPGEVVLLTGPTGCGKSTLLRLLCGLLVRHGAGVSSGSVTIDGRDVWALSPAERAQALGFVGQEPGDQLVAGTVGDEIAFGLGSVAFPPEQMPARVREMLQLVRLDIEVERSPSALSGGQQQRLVVASALAAGAKVLLLDEPLSALDLKLRKEMQVELKRLQHETGITFIFVTHDQEEALTMSDRVAVMNEGKILQIGAPHEIYNRPNNRFVADFIGDTNFISADVINRQTNEVRVRLPGGGEITIPAPDDLPAGNAITLAIRPEQARIATADDSVAMQGTLADEIYIGTDTQYRIDIGATDPFVVRVQNTDGDTRQITPQSQVGVYVDPGRVRILKD